MDQIHVLRHFTDDFSKYWWPLSDQERLFFSTTSAARHLKSFSNPTVIVFCSTFQTFCYRSTRAWARSFFPFYRPILDNLRLEQKKSPPTRLPEDKSVRPHCSLAFWGRPEKNGKLGVHNRRSRSEKKAGRRRRLRCVTSGGADEVLDFFDERFDGQTGLLQFALVRVQVLAEVRTVRQALGELQRQEPHL